MKTACFIYPVNPFLCHCFCVCVHAGMVISSILGIYGVKCLEMEGTSKQFLMPPDVDLIIPLKVLVILSKFRLFLFEAVFPVQHFSLICFVIF